MYSYLKQAKCHFSSLSFVKSENRREEQTLPKGKGTLILVGGEGRWGKGVKRVNMAQRLCIHE
jgi:hypothetical protein